MLISTAVRDKAVSEGMGQDTAINTLSCSTWKRPPGHSQLAGEDMRRNTQQHEPHKPGQSPSSEEQELQPAYIVNMAKQINTFASPHGP